MWYDFCIAPTAVFPIGRVCHELVGPPLGPAWKLISGACCQSDQASVIMLTPKMCKTETPKCDFGGTKFRFSLQHPSFVFDVSLYFLSFCLNVLLFKNENDFAFYQNSSLGILTLCKVAYIEIGHFVKIQN